MGVKRETLENNESNEVDESEEQVKRLSANEKKLRNDYRKLEAELSAVKNALGDLSPQQISDLLAKEEARKTKELEETQAYKEALEQRTKAYNEKVSEKEHKILELENRMTETTIKNELYKAYVGAGGVISDNENESLFDVFSTAIQPTLKVFSDGVFPVDAKGEPLLGDKGDVLSLPEYMETLRNKKFKVFFEAAQKPGMPPVAGSSAYARRASKTDPYEGLMGLETLKKYHELNPPKRKG